MVYCTFIYLLYTFGTLVTILSQLEWFTHQSWSTQSMVPRGCTWYYILSVLGGKSVFARCWHQENLLTINSDGSISASDSKMHKIYRNKISSKVQLYLSNSYKILTSREKWRHTLRVDKACPQKQLHKHNRKHNVWVAGNLFDYNNNSLLIHIYLSRYSASLASMRWCWWSASRTGQVNHRRLNTGRPLSVA